MPLDIICSDNSSKKDNLTSFFALKIEASYIIEKWQDKYNNIIRLHMMLAFL